MDFKLSCGNHTVTIQPWETFPVRKPCMTCAILSREADKAAAFFGSDADRVWETVPAITPLGDC